MADGLRSVVRNVAESADKGFPGQGIWVSGSFGTGKSHFLSFAGMLLRGEPAAWQREIPGLPAEGPDSPLAVLKQRRVFVVPFNSVDRPESFQLGLYDAIARELRRQPLPPLELTHFERIIQWFENLAADTPGVYDTLFRRSLVITSRADYDKHRQTAQGQETLARELTSCGIAAPSAATEAAYAAPVPEAMRRLTQHLKANGFAAVVFLVDELTLLLMNLGKGERGRPVTDLKNLLEAEGATLPVWALVVRHQPLEDVVREVGKDALDNLKGRMAAKEIDIADVDLYQVLGQRVLRPVPGQEKALDAAVQDSLDKIPPDQIDVLKNLYGAKRFQEAVRSLYPFHPAIVDTLVSVTHLLSRERTAISVMYDMLFDLADQPLGTLIPYHEAFRYLIEQASDGEFRDHPQLQAAKAIMRDKVTPQLEDAFVGSPERVARGQAVAGSVILGQLTDKGVALRGRMTPTVIAALNTEVLNGKVAILSKKQLDEAINLLCEHLLGTFKREGDAIVVELALGSDPMEELAKVNPPEAKEWERTAVREILHSIFSTDTAQGKRRLNVKWRGTSREGTVQAVEPGTSVLPPPEQRAEFAVWLCLPLFAGDACPPTPGKNGIPSALWQPQEADDETRQALGNLARLLWLTGSDPGKAYIADKYSGEEGRRLSQSWATAVIQVRETLTGKIAALYTQGTPHSVSTISEHIPANLTPEDALKDLAMRLLDARFRQHPQFQREVTSQALDSLYRGFIKGQQTITPDMGQVHDYALALAQPLGIVKLSGAAYALDLGNSRYVQEIEQALRSKEGVRVVEMERTLAGEFGLQPFVTRFLARMAVIFRDHRVEREHKVLAIDEPELLEIQSNDVLMRGSRVEHGAWAAFDDYCKKIGAPDVPNEQSVRQQDASWAAFRKFCDDQKNRYATIHQQVVSSSKIVGGAPQQLVGLMDTIKQFVDTVAVALLENTSEAGILALTKTTPPVRTLPTMIADMQAMARRLGDVEIHNLYVQLTTNETRAAAKDLVAAYVTDPQEKARVVTELKKLGETVVQVTRQGQLLHFTARLGQLRQALVQLKLSPQEGWDAVAGLPDNTDVAVEVRTDAES